MRALIVDDNTVKRIIAGSILRKFKYEVEFAMDATIGLSTFSARRFDIVIMDYHMPGQNGPDAIRSLRLIEQKNQYASAVVIAFSVDNSPDVTQKFRLAGADFVMEKRLSYQELSDFLASIQPVSK